MSKNKNTSKETKNKIPFNVLRKGAMALAVAGVMVATPFMLTGCAGEKGDVGPQGPAGSIWYSGTEYSAEQGKVGDFFYDTDDYDIYQKTNAGWTLISNIKGDTGVAKEIEIQTTADYIQWRYEGDASWQNLVSLASLKGVQGDDGRDVVLNVSGTHIQWKYEGEAEWENLISLESLKGLKGDDGKSAYEIALENDPSIGTEAEWLESLKGDTGKGITNVEVVYEYDEVTGQLYAVFTITYSEGEPQVIRSAVPKRVTMLNHISLQDGISSLERFAKVDSAENTPKMYLNVQFDDDTNGQIELTDDMFTVDQQSGLDIPDFTEVGVHNYEISYMGKTFCNQLEIVDLADYASYTVDYVNLTKSTFTTTSSLADLIVFVQYEEGVNLYASLTDVAESYYSYKTEQPSSELDLTVVDSYEVTLKSEFAFKYNPEDEKDATLYLTVYDEACSISYISVDDIELTLGDADFEDKLKVATFDGYLYVPTQNGSHNIEGTVEDLTYDLSAFDINRVGIQYIPFTYQLEGETGLYSNYFEVSVKADLSTAQAVGTYTVNQEDTNMMMFMMSQGNSITLYDNGVAVITNSIGSGQETQTTYDMELAETGVLKMFDSFMNDYSYFAINTETDTIGFYSVEGEITPIDYTCQIEMMGELFDAIISIYGTEGTCKAKVSTLMPKEFTGAPEDMFMPYSFVDCVWEDEDTISSIGRTFNVTTGNVLVEVTE